MQTVHTAGVPPNQGRMIFPRSGCTWKSRKADSRIVRAKRMGIGLTRARGWGGAPSGVPARSR
jgi:hypothetical protein